MTTSGEQLSKEPDPAVTPGDDAAGTPASKPAPTAIAGITATLIGTFTALAGAATVGGGVERVARTYPQETGFALVALAMASAVAGWALIRPDGKRGARLRFIASALFFVGLFFSGWAFVGTTRARTSPSVNLSVTDGAGKPSVVNAEVLASGLSAHQFLRVRILAFEKGTDPKSGSVLYLGQEGPNANGDVDGRIALALPVQHPDRLLVRAWQSGHEPTCDLDRDGLPARQSHSPWSCEVLGLP